MKKIRTPQEGAGAALSARSTTASNTTPQTPPEGVLSGFSATAEQVHSGKPVGRHQTRIRL